MAKLYFRYGAMGSSKTANALMVEYNYRERGKKALLAKPMIDMRDGEKIIRSRMGLEEKCIWTEELMEMSDEEIQAYDCVIVDEAQFCPKEQITYFTHIVDDLEVPVICYGLRADFQNVPFEGSVWLFACAGILSSFMARQAEHPGWRSSKPACSRISFKPSSIAIRSTSLLPGTIQTVMFSAFCLPFTK